MFGFKKRKEVPGGVPGEATYLRRAKRKSSRRHAGPYSSEQRRQAVEAYFKSGMTQKDFAKTWGTSAGSLFNWVRVYQEHGPKGLENGIYLKGGKKRGRKGLPAPVKEQIWRAKEENPEYGTRSVRNFLWRFRGVKVSGGAVRKTLREGNYGPASPRHKKRRVRKKPKIQRFERALPMQLWQTDITSLILARHSQRVYLTVFMDDHSRYVVSWALALQQTKEFVMETLLAGIDKFGKPEEVLTDQGRQYFAWRGQSDFRKLLKKQGIRHVVSRAHHPQTVGKCERFWETVQQEFWDRVEPQDLADARERLGQFILNYNHFRPHQGLEGLTPADRFFGKEQEIRKALEETISKNALKLALGEAPRSPVFLVGQIGDTPLSLHGEKGKLVLQTPDGKQQRLDYEDFGHAKKEPTATQTEGEKSHVESPNQAGSPGPRGSEQAAEEAPQEREVPHAQAAGAAGEGALGNGDAGATNAGARVIDRDHGVLAGPDHQAGDGGASENVAAADVAALPASDLGDGGGAAAPTQDASTPRNEEPRTAGAPKPGERPASAPQEDREPGADPSEPGSPDRGDEGDAGLQRCENPDGDPTDGVSGGSDEPCESQEGSNPESDESGTGRSSS
jgi:transposase InsO family protein